MLMGRTPTSGPYQVYSSIDGLHPHSEATVNPTLLLGFSRLEGLTRRWDSLYLEVRIITLLWVLPLLRVDASNLSIGYTPFQDPFQVCRHRWWDYPHSKTTPQARQNITKPIESAGDGIQAFHKAYNCMRHMVYT